MTFKHYSPQVKAIIIRQKSVLKYTNEQVRESTGLNPSDKSIQRWEKLHAETNSVIRNPDFYKKTGAARTLTEEQREHLKEMLEADGSLYLDELREGLYKETGREMSIAAVNIEVRERLGYTLKVSRKIHPCQDPYQRAAYTLRISKYPAQYLLFGDESAIQERDLHRDRSRAPKGHRANRVLSKVRGERYSLLPVISLQGLIACTVREGSFTHKSMKRFLREEVLPVMNPYPGYHSVLVLDNCTIHKHADITALFKSQGKRVEYLPAYSPDYNPIEKAFSVLKARWTRDKRLQTAEDPIAEIYRQVHEVFTPDLFEAEYRSCGYSRFGL